MKIVCLGGGPAGLYFGLLMKLQNPANEVTVVERNRPYDTFGWGVVFSDATMENLRQADPVSAQTIGDAFNHWDDIEVHVKGEVVRSTGHGFIGIGRKKLLNILQARCEEVGVKLVFETVVTDDQEMARKYDADLVIACDGINSVVRKRYEETYQPDIDQRQCRFVWLGTKKVFDAFNFIFVENEHGWFQAHAYRFEDGTSTFIVETPEETWQKAGIGEMSQEEGIAYCENLFAPYLDGHGLISNATHLRGSAIWIRFPRVICRHWVQWTEPQPGRRVPVVLMGDAAHTAHFSIGSGTKLALEDAIDLAERLRDKPLDAALQDYEALRGVEVLKIQNAARNSTEWFENVSRYAGLAPQQFAYSMLTRSQRLSHENLRLRDPVWLAQYEAWLAAQSGAPVAQGAAPLPVFTPYAVRGVTLPNRVVFSPTLTYACEQGDGMPDDFHLTHLGARALGGVGLVLTEAAAVTPDGRITPACTGLWSDAQAQAWKRVTDFVHQRTGSRIGVQLNHAGRRGATEADPKQADRPLAEGAWPLVSASALPYQAGVSQTPTALTVEGMQALREAFVAAAQRAAQAGFDWLELQAGHGFLLSSFISPLTNQREDAYGGSLENRMRFPLEVVRAVRQVWPADLPMSVRLSATDWAAGGTTVDDAVAVARMLREAGVDVVDCSSGEVVPDQKPVYGRMFQTPFADRIRNEAGIGAIAVGNITELDQVNGIIASGRADLCALSRPLLADPHWLLREAAQWGSTDASWPAAYVWGQEWMSRQSKRRAG